MIVNIIGAIFALIGALFLLLTLVSLPMLSEPNAPSPAVPFGIGAVLLALGGYLIFFV